MVSNIAAIMIDMSVVSLTACWVLDSAVLMSRIAATYVLVDCSIRSCRRTVLAYPARPLAMIVFFSDEVAYPSFP
jgi:hypothetical protein